MNHIDFADLLAHLLHDAERSASWLARRLQVHPSTVSRWLDGTAFPASLCGVDDILYVLNITDAQMERDLTRAYRNHKRNRRPPVRR
jgi:DNA-binding transcriptional ArsR family regulator